MVLYRMIKNSLCICKYTRTRLVVNLVVLYRMIKNSLCICKYTRTRLVVNLVLQVLEVGLA
jgi:hypothetical protein